MDPTATGTIIITLCTVHLTYKMYVGGMNAIRKGNN